MPNDRYILLWSFPREPDFIRVQRESGLPVRYVPLRYRVLHDLRGLVQPDQIVRPSAVVSPDARADLYRSAVVRLNAFHAVAVAARSKPWLGAVQQYMVLQLIYGFTYWRHFLRSLPPADIQLYPPFARSMLSGRQLVDVDMLAQAHAPPDGLTAMQRIRNTVDRALGWCAEQCPGLFSRPAPCPSDLPPGEMLLCGLQVTDWVAQAGLARALADDGSVPFTWLIPEQDRLAKSPDELSGLQHLKALADRTRRIPLDAYGYFADRAWRRPRLERAARLRLAHALRPAIRAALPESDYAPWHGALAYLVAVQNPDAHLKYLAAQRMLDRAAPRLVVLSSGIDQLTYVRSWARHRRVPVVRLPHGVEAHLDARYAWDAGCIGVLGSRVAARLRVAGCPAETVAPAGGLHLAQQGQETAARVACLRAERPPEQGRILLMFSGYWGYDYPDAMDELRADFEALARALKPVGGRMALRCHPRHVDAATFQLLCDEIRGCGLEMEWSDARKSLAEDLARSEAALTRTWNGSALMSLYAELPVIAWLPRPTYHDLEEPLRALPLCAQTADEAAALFASVRQDERRRFVLERQREQLQDFIASPWDRPYERAVRILRAEWKNVEMEGRKAGRA